MTDEDDGLVAAVQAAKRTELDRLGSDKALIAFTDATLEPAAVFGGLAAREAALQEVYAGWAADGGDAADVYADAADRAADRRDGLRVAVADEDDADGTDDAADALAAALSDLDPDERPGGLVAAGLVADRTYLQAVNFFVNEADERSADRCRDLREDARSDADAGERALRDGARESSLVAAERAVDAAYREYTDRLEGMGLDPKPVC